MASSSTRFSIPAPEAVRVLVTLLEDESHMVRESSVSALKDISSRSPILVLDSCFALYRGRRRRFGNIAGLFQVMACGVRSLDKWEVEHSFMRELARIAVVEAISVKDLSADCQTAASALLVSIGSQLPDVMMDEVISYLSGSSSGVTIMIQILADFALDNALEFAPHLKNVLLRVLPILGNVKDAHRSVFANAFTCWCQALVQYGVDFPAHSFLDGDVISFLHSAFELFLRVWTASRDIKVRVTTVEALGQMAGLITQTQLKAALPRLVPTIIDLYKKDQDVILSATFTLHNLLNYSLPLDDSPPLLDFEDVAVILATLLSVIGTINEDHSNFSVGLKTYNEVQHCFLIVGQVYHGDLLIFLINKCKLKEASLIFGTISVLKHLLPRLSEAWEKKRPMLVESVKMLLDEQDLCVRIAISELILVMASNCYLVGLDGELFIEYLVRNCSVEYQRPNCSRALSAIYFLPSQHKKLEVKHGLVSHRDLREICEKGLLLLTITVPDIETVLWPFLLKMLVPQIYTGAVATLCQCISELCKGRSSSCRMMITDCQTRADIPCPEKLLARMVVLLHDPLATNQIALHIFTALCHLAPIFPKNINIFWQEEVPKLKAYISDTEDLIQDSLFQETWDGMIINFLADSIDVINDERWMVSLGNAFASQYELYAPNDDHIALLHCCLGITLQKINDKNFVRGKIDWMYKQANIACPSNRLGLAKAIGLVASSHLDNVLEKLKAILDIVGQNFFRRILFVFSDRASMESDDIHAALALMYGYAARYAPSTVIEARIDALVGTNMLGRLLHVKSPMAKQAVITAIDLLGRAVINASESGISFPLKRRNQLLDYVLTLMGRDDSQGSHVSSPENLQTQALAISACTTLVMVEPKLNTDTQNIIMKATLEFFALPNEPSDVVNPLVDNLITLLCAILQMSCEDARNQAEKLLYLLREVDCYIFSVSDYQRRRVCHAVHELLLKFRSLCLPGYAVPRRHTTIIPSAHFDLPSGKYVILTRHSLCNGERVMVYLPHCADVNADIRKVCSEILALFFAISLSLQNPVEMAADSHLELSYAALSSLENVISILKSDAAIDPSEIFDRVLASICVLLTKEELVVALHNCSAAICNNIKQSAEGTIQAVVEFVSRRGNELGDAEISGTAQALISAAGNVVDKNLRQETISAISSLAEITSSKIVFEQVLLATTEREVNTNVVLRPHSSWPLQEIFHAFSQHSTLSSLFLQHVITVLGQTPVIRSEIQAESHPSDGNEVLKATILALTAFFRGGGKVCRKVSAQNYSIVLAVLIHKFGSCQSISGYCHPDILRSLLTCFQAFCECVGDLEMGKIFGREGFRSDKEKWVDVIGDLASCIYTKRSKEVPNICLILIRSLTLNDAIERGSAAASLSEFIRYCCDFGTLLDQIVEVLSQCVSDASSTIRRHCLRGLMQIPSSKISSYSSQILSITLALFEDCDETVQVMSVSCLLMVLESSSEEVVEPLLLNISDRLCILQASMNTMIRANAFVAFGSLASYGTGVQHESFLEQVHAAIPGLVLHLYDDELSVRLACRKTLRRVIPLLEIEDLVHIFSSQSFNSDSRHDYQDFVRDFTRRLCQHLAFRLDAYITSTIQAYDSPWHIVQENAIYFSTCLLSFSDNQHLLALHFTEVFGLLMGKMSQSADAGVRSSSSAALGLLLKSTNQIIRT